MQDSALKIGDVVEDADGTFHGCLGIVSDKMDIVWEHGGRAGPWSTLMRHGIIRRVSPPVRIAVPPGATGWRVWNREQAVVAALRRAGLSPTWRKQHPYPKRRKPAGGAS